ncbi:MAG TPA: hypothetical protein VHE81_03955 [Lacipirellulaceae bacterium]|nr:hypothetical protein [Lacipirellulaceae bacterium]
MPQEFDVAIWQLWMPSEERDVHGPIAYLLDMIARSTMAHVDSNRLMRTRKLNQQLTKEARGQRTKEADAKLSARAIAGAPGRFDGVVEIAQCRLRLIDKLFSSSCQTDASSVAFE